MADRPAWTGTLKIDAVEIPVRTFLATDPPRPTFALRQIHEGCQTPTTLKADEPPAGTEPATPIQHRVWCATCDKEVPPAELVKGYEFEEGRYVVLRPEELEAITPESTRCIDLVEFAFAEELEPRMIDRAYFLAPNGASHGPAADAYQTVQEAMVGAVGIGTLAVSGHGYVVAVAPRGRVLLLYTLHRAEALRAAPVVADGGTATPELKLARGLIGAMRRPLDLAAFPDPYARDFAKLVKAKIAGQEILIPRPVSATPAVVHFRQALEQSLRNKTPAKVTPARVPGPHRGARDRRVRQRA